MSDFLSEAFDPDTVAAQAKIEEKETYVYVEGIDDVDFWYDLFSDEKVDVSATSREEKNKSHKGKSALRKLLPQANKNLIIVIDSDFDFLCPDNSEASLEFNSCKYVIQTQFYSKENIIFQPKSVDKNLAKTRLNNECITSDYKSYIEAFSAIIYDCFAKFLFLRNLRVKPITSKDFHSKIIPKFPIFDNSYVLKNNPFDNLTKNIAAIDKVLTQEIVKLDDWDNKFELFKKNINTKGFSEKTAHCFINGHTLEDSIISHYINAKTKALVRNLMVKVRAECASETQLIEGRCKEISNLIQKNHNFFTRIGDCSEKYNQSIAQELKTKFLEIRK